MQTVTDEALDYSAWLNQATDLRETFLKAKPFPHLVLDDFLFPSIAERLNEVYHDMSSRNWYYYSHINNKTYALPNRFDVPEETRRIIEEFLSPKFISLLGVLTGIHGLIADEKFEAGGFMAARREGYLNIHSDYTVHPHHTDWRRELNVLIYLNEDWQRYYNGHLELWDRDVKNCIQSISPKFNRCVLFKTSDHSFHGYPDPLACPEDTIRKCLGLYYYSIQDNPIRAHATDYRPRPQDASKAIPIYFDKKLLQAYDWLKRTFGISDQFASNLMKWFR